MFDFLRFSDGSLTPASAAWTRSQAPLVDLFAPSPSKWQSTVHHLQLRPHPPGHGPMMGVKSFLMHISYCLQVVHSVGLECLEQLFLRKKSFCLSYKITCCSTLAGYT